MEITCKEIVFSGYAVQRLFERGLKAVQVQSIIESGEVIASYPGDQPLPSFLILGWVKERITPRGVGGRCRKSVVPGSHGLYS
jgi:hypothetical protein